MTELLQRLVHALVPQWPAYGIAAIVVFILYVLEGNIRFGKEAQASQADERDRHSTTLVAAATIVPVVGFTLAMDAYSSTRSLDLPFTLAPVLLWPGAPRGIAAFGWAGVALSALGASLRLWAVMTLRERYTRTLLVQDGQAVERTGPYRVVRHPGYTGSLLCLNGIALASSSAAILGMSLVTTIAAYVYRVRAEDAMLVDSFGEPYAAYRRETAALVPLLF